jgi:hypothetical protein
MADSKSPSQICSEMNFVQDIWHDVKLLHPNYKYRKTNIDIFVINVSNEER